MRANVVELDHQPNYLMHHVGLPDDPTLNDLFDPLAGRFEFQDSQVSEVSMFGVPTLRVRAETADEVAVPYMGLLADEAFLLSFLSPDEASMQAFMPAIEAMVASIRPIEE